MTIDVVIFDIGNVLIEWNPERHYDATIGEARRKEMFAVVDLHGINLGIDTGAPFRQTIERAAKENPAFHDEIMMWYFDWDKMATPQIPHSVALLRALRAKGVRVIALTNFGAESFEFAETRYLFLAGFDKTYVSGRLGCVKPHRLIYEMLEAGEAAQPDTFLFVDDRPENIDMAARRGWQTHLFDGAEGWARRLVEAGLLTADEAGL